MTSITQQPQSQAVQVGGTVNFSVAVTGAGPFTYKWSKDGMPISGAMSATFSIASALTSDAGAYAVTITYPGGSMSSLPATLSVSIPNGTSATRQITRFGTNFFVTVTVVPPIGTPAYLVEEFIPTGFTVRDISNSGDTDTSNARITWGMFWDDLTRTLSYTLVPPAGFTGMTTLNGETMLFGGPTTTTGDNSISGPTNHSVLGLSQFYQYFVVTITGDVGSTYRLETSPDLTPGSWQPLVTFTLDASSFSYLDWGSAGKSRRFYRTALIE